ncbi:PQ-loop-domain-containing protein [Cristinia sonorae]|uniref:PQ-loop-domain-containing protein n=1 Tax=Cristinia sonorae TaxID=1940300 RepID=A0A8K0UJS7_9AGAR|nr:PQ-loop-domain-containing protein [Cristinia sonorae]
MSADPLAENVLGTIGTICWTLQLVPQVWKSWRTKSTDGLSLWLVWLWGISGTFLSVYAIVQKLNVPLIVQPHLFSTLCFISWAQCLYYGKGRSRNMSLAILVGMVALSGGFEAGMIFAIQPSFDAGKTAPTQFFGIMSAVLISLALFPQYYEIYKFREVIGISILFMLVDCLGGVFSNLSLAFKEPFDIIAAITYSLVVVLDGIVLVLAFILNPRAERRRKRDAQAEIEAGDASSVRLEPPTMESIPIPTDTHHIDGVVTGETGKPSTDQVVTSDAPSQGGDQPAAAR